MSAVVLTSFVSFNIVRADEISNKLTEITIKQSKLEYKASEIEEKLKNAGISIEYMYAFIGKSDKGALVIVRVENPEKALEVLKDENVTVVSPEEVYRM